jgi:hypothetical protein
LHLTSHIFAKKHTLAQPNNCNKKIKYKMKAYANHNMHSNEEGDKKSSMF